MAYNYPFPYDAAAKSAIASALNTSESVCLHKDTAPASESRTGRPVPARRPWRKISPGRGRGPWDCTTVMRCRTASG